MISFLKTTRGPPPLRRQGWRKTNRMQLDPWVMTIFCLISLFLSLSLTSSCLVYFFLYLYSHLLLNKVCIISFDIWSVWTSVWADTSLTNWIITTCNTIYLVFTDTEEILKNTKNSVFILNITVCFSSSSTEV